MLSWLFGNSKAADAAVNGIDALVFTDQEKATMDAAAMDKILDFKIEYAKHTQNQSIARRIIAIIVSGLWALLILIAAIAGYFDAGGTGYAAYIGGIVVTSVNPPFMVIIGFYFAAHVVKGLRKQ